MSFVKKWLGCIISFIAGVCGLALSACTGMVVKVTTSNETISAGLKAMGIDSYNTKAFKVLTDNDLYTQAKELGLKTEFVWMKIFAIITLVIAVLLIIWSIVLLLKNLNVIKSTSKVFDITTIVLVTLFLIATIGLLIASNSYASGAEKIAVDSLKLVLGESASLVSYNVKVGAYQPTMLIISIITFVATCVPTFIKTKEA